MPTKKVKINVMLAIGFTQKYYTLWDVDVRKQYSQNERGQTTAQWNEIYYSYLGNLSMDLDKAKEKAKEKGCTNLEPNMELYGRNNSWVETTPKEIIFEKCERSELIMICCANRKENTKEAREQAIKTLIDKGYCEMVYGILTISEKVHEMKKFFLKKMIFLNESVSDTYEIEKNCNEYGLIEKSGFILDFKSGVKSNYYNGFNYYLPLDSSGKSKKIKGKTIVLKDFEVQKVINFENPYGVWEDSKTNTLFYTEKDEIQFYGTNHISIKDFEIIK